jgi:hypothetical protein
MTEENIIKLTNALYKVTGLFPKEEPLKFAIRKEALDVLFFTALIKGESLTITREERGYYFKKAAGKIDLIGTYFDIAENQDWINEKNFSILRNEYSALKEIFEFEAAKSEEAKKPIILKKEEPAVLKKEEPGEEDEPEKKEKIVDPERKVEREESHPEKEIEHLNYEDLSNVQLRVLEILQGKGQLKSNQISQFFPDMNPRTIRRELKGLKEMKIIVANGGGKTTVYEINKTY